MPSDAAWRGDDATSRRNAKPLEDRAEVARLLLARGPGVLVDREEHLGMAEEQILGPVHCDHRLTMGLALFGGVAGPLDAALRLGERCLGPVRSWSVDRAVLPSDL